MNAVFTGSWRSEKTTPSLHLTMRTSKISLPSTITWGMASVGFTIVDDSLSRWMNRSNSLSVGIASLGESFSDTILKSSLAEMDFLMSRISQSFIKWSNLSNVISSRCNAICFSSSSRPERWMFLETMFLTR